MSNTLTGSFYEDIKPRNWISKYHDISIKYLILMFLFYHSIGILFSIIGTLIINDFIVGYEEPSIPLSLIRVISAGPIEESLFFGMPFYFFGNSLAALAGGIVWAMLHILNTYTIEINQLAYANWLFAVPSLFFSLRTWISGMGWFAVLGHSVWNCFFFMSSCISGEISCSYGITNEDITVALLAGILLTLTYILVKRRKTKLIQ